MSRLTKAKIRNLSLAELGIDNPAAVPEAPVAAPEENWAAEFAPLEDTDEILTQVREALALGFAGVILSGPPGTGKSWYAKRVAGSLAQAQTAIRVAQFHPSYQYEDFMEGYVPAASGTFVLQPKIFPSICVDARENGGEHVLIIDEFSRCDVARVFGEALTYLEQDKRGQTFTLASGREVSVPPNLIVIATMNPWDKGVDELDVALERRFAQIEVSPNADTLANLLKRKGASPAFVEKLVAFFGTVQRMETETLHVGHSYFLACTDEQTAQAVWRFRLDPFFRKATRLAPDEYRAILAEWQKVVVAPAAPAAAVEEPAPEAPVDAYSTQSAGASSA